jgi:P4 family phage/plasmid primase-like protien
MAEMDPGPIAAMPAPDPVLRRARLDMNDLGNARRLVELSEGKLLFVGELGRQGEFVHFDGARWSVRDGKARALAMAQRVVDDLLDEARAVRMATPEQLSAVFGVRFTKDMADERAGQLFGWAMKTGNSDRASGMLKQAQGVTDENDQFLMRASLDDFDTDPLAWHCINGAIRFVEGPDGWEFRFEQGHRPGDRFMQMANVVFDAGAKCPAWRARLELLHRDVDARVAIQRIYGMTLTALTSDQAFYIFQGKGGDGKSMTNAMIAHIQGDYFRSTSPRTFLESKQARNASDHQSDIVRLRGDIRLVVFDEPKKGSTWDGERIKQVTGSLITARAPNAVEEITFKPHWKLIGECNTIPRPPSDDRGFRRRFKLYPWTIQFGVTPGVEDRPEHIVRAELMDEKPGILNWMIEGAIDWLSTMKVPEPELSKRALSSFWAAGSIMGEWLEARCDLSDPDVSTGATPLYADFKEFCAAQGVKEDRILTQTSFGSALTEAQIYSDKDGKGLKVRLGIRLRDPSEVVSERTASDTGDDWKPPW